MQGAILRSNISNSTRFKLQPCARLSNYHALGLTTSLPRILRVLRKPHRQFTIFPSFSKSTAANAAGDSSAAAESTPKGKGNELSTVLRLAIPALGIVLSDPLQTLVDSACVGRQSTIQLAALGPNTALFNAVFQVFSFLGIATANFIATNSLTVENLSLHTIEQRRNAASTALSNSLVLAVILGILATTVLQIFGRTWLIAMGTDPVVLPLAVQYLSIRAWATPAVLVMNACQGACLGQQDTLTPMQICIIATLINIIGDIYLVFGLGTGVQGAAFASAQVCAATLITYRVWNEGRKNPKTRVPLRWAGIPTFSSMRPFLEVATTLIARTAVGMVAYFSMAVAATRLGTINAASHQVAMQIFWFISFFADPLSMSAQSLIAKERTSPQSAKRWAWMLITNGLTLSVILAAIVAGLLQFGSGLFTTDPLVQAGVRALAPHSAAAMVICGVMMIFDGISLGAGTFRHLPAAVGVGMGTVLSVLWYGGRSGGGLSAVWWALIAFYAARLGSHLVYYALTWKMSVFNAFGNDDDSPQTAAAAQAA
jgi:putative MATE family efflux protein